MNAMPYHRYTIELTLMDDHYDEPHSPDLVEIAFREFCKAQRLKVESFGIKTQRGMQ